MLKFVILLSAVACVLGGTIPEGLLPQLDGRIVGGTATDISSCPWQASLQLSGSPFCGGSIYSSTHILTAAHCVKFVPTSILMIRVGSSDWNSGGTLVGVAAIKIHEDYNPNTMDNDIALIRLSSSLIMSSTIKSIALASTDPPNGAAASVTGWGVESYGTITVPTQVRVVDVEIVDQETCDAIYSGVVSETMICAAAPGKGVCQGDSGGPLVSDGVQVGIDSWGPGCADPKYPGIYTSAAAFRKWVEDNVGSV